MSEVYLYEKTNRCHGVIEMSTDRLKWLKSLEVGESVGIKEVTEGIGDTYTYSTDKITGMNDDSFTVSSGLIFNSKGINEFQSNTYVSLMYELVPVTNEVKQKGKFYNIKKLINLITTGGIQ
ncbi:hypothetical protein V1498_19655 [Peribacillus sp. SCS-26]|uniref:hypothetical protein n=1 Tax=Paraperibacillus marinus TaxID=3115295 RepID=UPI0039069BDF